MLGAKSHLEKTFSGFSANFFSFDAGYLWLPELGMENSRALHAELFYIGFVGRELKQAQMKKPGSLPIFLAERLLVCFAA